MLSHFPDTEQLTKLDTEDAKATEFLGQKIAV
jgi:hypothetical protein